MGTAQYGSNSCNLGRGTMFTPICETDGVQTGWPLKRWTINYGCGDGFFAQPMVFAKVQSSAPNKMYAASVHAVTKTSFGINVQRTDNMPPGTPQEECSDLQLCYLALAGFRCPNDCAIPIASDCGDADPAKVLPRGDCVLGECVCAAGYCEKDCSKVMRNGVCTSDSFWAREQ